MEDTDIAENVYHNYSDTDTDDENEFDRAKYQRESYEEDIARNLAYNLELSNQKKRKGECSRTVPPIEEG